MQILFNFELRILNYEVEGDGIAGNGRDGNGKRGGTILQGGELLQKSR